MRIAPGSMGSFLCPPGHPAHEHEIQDGPARHPTMSVSLDWALREENQAEVPERIRQRVQALYDAAVLVRSEGWERMVYGYFRNCYAPPDLDRDVRRAVIPKPWEETPPPERHLGYLTVRDYFPDAEPRLDLITFSDGYGQRPCRKCGTALQYEARVDGWAEPISAVRDCPRGGIHET